MKVKRYVAASMRAALDLVRTELGPDALIIGNRKIAEGVEILVADEKSPKLPDATEVAAVPPRHEPRMPSFSPTLGGTEDLTTELPEPLLVDAPTERRRPTVRRASEKRSSLEMDLWTQDDVMQDMQNELRALRDMVEQQLSGFAWGSYGAKNPARAAILRHLVKAGITATLARDVLTEVSPRLSQKDAWHRALGLIAHRIHEYPESLFDDGGVYAVCGPSGVGKTSVIAKIAARRALSRGADGISIISADNQRIGAHQQLRSIGRILGVPVHQVDSVRAASDEFRFFQPRHLMLIDTAGNLDSVATLEEEFRDLEVAARSAIRPILVLAANTDLVTIDATMKKFMPLDPVAAVITKTDEAPTIGTAVSAMIEAQIPIAFVSNGPHIPDDLTVAVAHQIVADLASRIKNSALANSDINLRCEHEFVRSNEWTH